MSVFLQNTPMVDFWLIFFSFFKDNKWMAGIERKLSDRGGTKPDLAVEQTGSNTWSK